MSVIWLEGNELIPTVVKQLKQVDVVLDIGCGIYPQNLIKPKVHICCEPFKQYVEKLQTKLLNEYGRNYILINATWEEALKLFPSKSVDTIFLLDVIEHLEKENAVELLKKTEYIARQQIAIFTPLGLMPQKHPDGKDGWGLNGGKWQEHKSGWVPEDFDNTWEVYVSKVFHEVDSMLRPLEIPYGALWAIKNYPFNYSDYNKVSKRRKMHTIFDNILDFCLK